ncbi:MULTISPECIES: SbmA/BacA-like family transporter [Bradyrhizobium]|uniref:ABC transporter n=1 Tax=Bradyrhizobium nanningense TaxID=1325118 RepID=A0A4V1L0S5_9BRAD|nr:MULTISPECIES: SbmA/BacA-like family transporter [Bradyrhizobium]RXH21479.1 ABC transporter [Bradyrhizobium nanningense]RXH30504.1 ABC transporter [Bradyrhizobium nanningense]TQF31617.1 ABC transporter [Bradyrhizobium sp. UNPA324]
MLTRTSFVPGEKQLLGRFWQSASGYWRGPTAWTAWLLVVALIINVILQLLTQYGLNFWNRDFFNAVGRKDQAELLSQALRFLPLAAASIALTVFSVWARMTLQRSWREWLSSRLYGDWLADDRSAGRSSIEGHHEAPEYRIAEDAKVATDLPIDLVTGLLQSVLTIATFVGVLWSVGGSLAVNVDGIAFAIPGYLVLAVIAYSGLLVIGIWLTAGRLTRVIEENKRMEAELRAIGTHVRETREGKVVEEAGTNDRHAVGAALKAVIAIWRIYCWQLMRMTLVTYTGLLVTPVVGLLLCLPKYLDDTMTLGEVVQASAAFVVVQTAFNWFTDNYAKLAEWTASANRVAELLLALDADRATGAEAGHRSIVAERIVSSDA